MDLNKVNKLWYDSKPVQGIKFGLNECVQIIEGEHKGKNASVISLISIEPVKYLVELDLFTDDCDAIVLQSEMERAE